MRIVSLIPEATEILDALGLADEVVALPAPDAFDAGLLWDAQTTHVFTSDTGIPGGMARHLVRRHIALKKPKPRPAVYALDPRSVGEILSDIKTVGDAVGRQAAARTLIERLRARIDAVSLRAAHALAAGPPKRVVCLERADPPVATGWWLAELVGLAGGIDVLDGVGRPPRDVTWDEIRAAEPELVLVAGPALRVEALTPGPGAIDLLERLAALIMPEADPAGAPGCEYGCL
jgi:ABC-type Fe3+-hydroxamate transport system substrate-binding protein